MRYLCEFMKKQDLKNREDIYRLVDAFYKKVRKDVALAPFFEIIEDWDEHLDRLTTFWESSLFLKTKYHGDPLMAHVKADSASNNRITQEHFGLWLNLWIQTIDELFEGDYAENAKSKARKMATFMYLKVFESRQNQTK